jgi:hypothetical protein
VHRKNRFSPANVRTAAQERGASAPRVKQNAVANRNRASPTICVRSPRAGGVSPPCSPWTQCTGNSAHYRSAVCRTVSVVSCRVASQLQGTVSRTFAVAPLQMRYPRPRRADARRSWLDVRSCIAKIVFRRQTFAPQYKSGGRQPPVATLHGSTTWTRLHRMPVIGTRTVGGLP